MLYVVAHQNKVLENIKQTYEKALMKHILMRFVYLTIF